MVGPTYPISIETHIEKYRNDGESFEQVCRRIADTLGDGREHTEALFEILYDMRFLPGGRIQKDIGSPYSTTAFNCFVSGTIHDSMESIMTRLSEAAETLRRGGGIGYDFSTLRPRGEFIKTLNSKSSGPIEFMRLFDALCSTIQSAGHRRGAQMGVMRCDHPDIFEFIQAKRITEKNPQGQLTQFNISVAITDEFIDALKNNKTYWTTFSGKKYKEVLAEEVWETIMKHTWDYAEPGVLFIDRINRQNPLWYIENIAATNPCGEVPLPPYGACLLGSFNLTKYIMKPATPSGFSVSAFDYNKLKQDTAVVVRAMDNVIDKTNYPLVQQAENEQNKRRMGIGVTGVANTLEAMGYSYGSEEYLTHQNSILHYLKEYCYTTSCLLAEEKGSFPLFNKDKHLSDEFNKFAGTEITRMIDKYGLRNGCLLAIAPTGTISLCADNISSGIEPPFKREYTRDIKNFDGKSTSIMTDFAWREWGIACKEAGECTIKEHVDVLCSAQKYVDHAVSKTCNVGAHVSFDEFKDIYMYAYDNGAKGLTTFRDAGELAGVLKACTIDETGKSDCG